MSKPRTAAQIAAAKRNLAKAAHKPRTAAQIAAERRNLAKAAHKPRTAAQRAAAEVNLAKAQHKPHTAAQHAATMAALHKAETTATYQTPTGTVTTFRLHKNHKNTLKKRNRSRTLRKATGRTKVPR